MPCVLFSYWKEHVSKGRCGIGLSRRTGFVDAAILSTAFSNPTHPRKHKNRAKHTALFLCKYI